MKKVSFCEKNVKSWKSNLIFVKKFEVKSEEANNVDWTNVDRRWDLRQYKY